METFYRKNDIGVNIEYTILGRYNDHNEKYILYTDFVEDPSSVSGIRIYVANDTEEKELLSK